MVLQFDIFRFSSFPKIHNRLVKFGYVSDRSICPQPPLREGGQFCSPPLWEALRLRCAAPYHRDFTSAGFSASPIGKYHYHSDCRCRLGGNPSFRSGVLAASSQVSYRSFPCKHEKLAHYTAPPFPKKSIDFSGTLRSDGRGVPTFGLIIRNKVLNACLFNCQKAAKGRHSESEWFLPFHLFSQGKVVWGLCFEKFFKKFLYAS